MTFSFGASFSCCVWSDCAGPRSVAFSWVPRLWKENATAAGSGWSYSTEIGAGVSASDDQSDVEKVLAGEVAAFEGIVRRWQGPLVNLAYRFTRDRARAEELAQEAFLRAYRSLGGWRREAAFSTWLFALSTNLYRSELRRVPAIIIPLDRIAELREARTPDGNLHDADRDRTGKKTKKKKR